MDRDASLSWRGARAALIGLATVALVSLSAGCAQSPSLAATQVVQDHLFPASAEAAAAAAEADRVFAMSEEMRRYAEQVLQQSGVWHDRRQGLIDALYLKDALRLAYDAEATRTAAQAFAARAGNCLSLVLMTAAFAKHLDLPVSYQQVLVDDEFSRSGDLYFVSGHINVLLGRYSNFKADDAQWLTIDFLPQIQLRGQRTVPLGERTLVAMFLNNRAAEALARGEVQTAYWWARASLQRDETFAAAANTLGVIYQRAGHPEAAERALRFVIEHEPRDANAWSNLARLLRAQGRDEEARAATARLAQLEPNPPFHSFELGRVALQQGDAARARDLFERELRLQPQQHEVHFWLAQAYAALGDAPGTARHLAFAADYSPTRQRRAIYAAKLDRLRALHPQ